MNSAKVYGIPNCGSVKKAVDWLNQNNIPFVFHDYKKFGVTKKKLEEWGKHFGLQNLINTKGTTWQTLNDEQKNSIDNDDDAVQLMIENTSLIKRPVIEWKKKYLIRFNEEEYAKTILKK